jgi:hypothetical protein
LGFAILGQKQYSSALVRYWALVRAEVFQSSFEHFLYICFSIGQRFRAEDFQIPQHRKALSVVRHTMRKFITIILTFLLPAQICLGQTTNEIINLKIYRVDRNSIWQDKPQLNSIYYDERGNIIKEEETFGNTNYKSMTTYKYLDTLLSQVIEQEFEKNKLIGNSISDITYQFDNKNRIKSKTTKKSNKEISKELYSYNIKNQFDTVFIYNNDTTIWTPKQPFTGIKKLKKLATVKRVRVYDYSENNKIVIKDCFYPINTNDNSSCRTYENIESDTLDISIEKFWGSQGCIMNSDQTMDTTISHKRNGQIYLYETTMLKGKNYYEYKKNEFGLIAETKAITISYGKKTEKITKWKYYFRK